MNESTCSRPQAARVFLIASTVVGALLFYVLSIGPVSALLLFADEHHAVPRWIVQVLEAVYWPVTQSAEQWPFAETVLSQYLIWWWDLLGVNPFGP